MPKTWKGKECYEFNLVKDRQQPIHSTRYFAMVSNPEGPERRFDVYVPDAVFGSFAGPQQIRMTIESVQSPAEVDGPGEDIEPLRALDPALLDKFEEAMRNIYRESTKIGYYPTRFLQMIEERGALETARHLLYSPHLSDGFITLWEKKRLDLSVEALVIDSKWRDLFSKEDLTTASSRLESIA